jgi:hypothetical protein
MPQSSQLTFQGMELDCNKFKKQRVLLTVIVGYELQQKKPNVRFDVANFKQEPVEPGDAPREGSGHRKV